MNTPLTDIRASGPAILILGYQCYALVFAKFSCEKSLQTVNYSFMEEKKYCNIK